MTALTDRLRQHAQLHQQCTVQDDEQSMFADDLLAAAEEIDRLREQVTEMREICKLGFRALDAAGTALLTVEPESSAEHEPMSDLLQQVHDVSLSLFTVARLPAQEAARAFYGKAKP